MVHCGHASIWHSCGDMVSQMWDKRTDGRTDTQVILYSVQCRHYCAVVRPKLRNFQLTLNSGLFQVTFALAH